MTSLTRLRRWFARDLRYIRRYRNISQPAWYDEMQGGPLETRFLRALERHERAVGHHYRRMISR